METQPHPPVRLVFGSFEVNVATGELRKDGVRVPLPHQPLRVLLLLLAHPGDVVTREQLREKLWAEGTFVDFERGLNSAINKLRRALFDSAEKPRYIETVPGRGYRFIGAIEHRIISSSPLITNETAAGVDRVVPPARRVLRPGTWLTAVAVALAFALGIAVTRLLTKPSFVARPVLQFLIPPPPGTIFAPPIGRHSFAISPDGTRLAFTATGSNGTNIWIRDLATLNAWAVPGTEGAWTVFWSPDSRSIFYSVKRSLKQASVATASTRSVANLPFTTMSGTWRSSGDLLLYLGPHRSYELLVENGALRELPDLDVRWPQFLPDSDHFLHVVFDSALGRYRAVMTDYISKKSTPLVETDSQVEYAPPNRAGQPGALFYVRGPSLVIQSFDSSRLHLAGEPLAIVQNITYFRPSASACFSVSDNGVLVYQTGFPVSELNWYDRTGRVVGAAGRPAPYAGEVRIAPDGQRVAAAVWSPENGDWDIWILDANGRESRRLTYPPAQHARPVWSPEGTSVAFGMSQTGPPGVAILQIAEASKERAVAKEISPMQEPREQIQLPTDWSSDGRFIAFDTGLGEEEQEVWLAETSSGKVMPLLHNEFAQWGAVFSRDGKRLAFVSAESGRPEIYVQTFDSIPSPQLIGSRRQVSRDGGWMVRWRADGRELFYLDTNSWLYAVPVEGPLRFGEPKRLFRIAGSPQYGTTSDFQFDVTPDGQRFIMSTTSSAAPPPFVVVENWQDKFGR